MSHSAVRPSVVALLLAAALIAPTVAGAAEPGILSQSIEIPYQRFTLDNGLTLLVHEDSKAPIAAVNVWYHVGSKNEKPGKTGFAHLFEHLMFNGSENFNSDYFKAVEPLGATDLNGTTNEDRTNYFQNVPKSALDTILWLESDRMGHLLGAIDQAKLDEQRGVVQNEKRQYDNQPYSISEEMINKACFPAGHPYSWTVIGLMEDLDAAALDDVKHWFQSYYGAANAVLVVAGDVQADDVHERIKRYFGDIPPGPPVARHDAWIAKRTGEQRQRAQDRVPQSRIYKVWNVPPAFSDDADLLGLAAQVLSSGKSSRLYKRLVYDEQIATSVTSYVDEREIASLFQIVATAKPGVGLGGIERAIDEELARLLREGPTPDELTRAKTETISGFIRGIERIGGFGGKSDILARSQVYGGDPDAWKHSLDVVRNASPTQVRDALQRWLSDGVYVLEITPYPDLEASTAGADRSKMPDPGAAPEPAFPKFERATLSNGLEVVLARRTSVPVVEMSLIVDGGYAADSLGIPGMTSLAMDMLDEGTKTRSSVQISDELATLGASLGTGAGIDTCTVGMSALKVNLDPSLNLFADVVMNPSFPEADFKRLKAQRIAAIQREKSQPFQMGLRVFPPLLFGTNHAYGLPFTGTGYEETVNKITRDDLAKFHQTWFHPTGSKLVVVGDVTLAELTPKLESRLKDWKPGSAPKKNVATVENRAKSAVYIIDRPGSVQSVLIAGQVVPPKANPDEITLETMNDVLGGSFISRINMNLREDKHWSYGAFSIVADTKAQRPAMIMAQVQSDKTKESMVEMKKEMVGIQGTRPVTPEELAAAKDIKIRSLAGRWETNGAVEGGIVEIVQYGLPDDYFQKLPEKVRTLAPADLERVAKAVIDEDRMVWVVVGDRKAIEPGIRELGFGEVQIIDADGKPVM